MIRAVAFDAYGTLFRTETAPNYWYAREIIERQGLDADADALEQAIRDAWPLAVTAGMASLSSDQPLDPAVELDRQLNGPVPEWRSAWDIWQRQYAAAFRHQGVAGDSDDAANYLREVLARLEVYPDADATLIRLDASGLLLGLLSNADEDFLQRALSRARLGFSVIQSSESLRVYKPHRGAFLGLCSRLGCEPHEVLYAGDSATADVMGARNAGLHTVWVQREWSVWPEGLRPADLHVTTLSEIADALGL